MVSFIVRRGMGMLISTFLVISITFAFMQMIPGDPADVLLGPNATPEQIASLRATWGLDQSIWVQYYRYIVNFLHGDLGESLFSRQPVLRMIGQHAETSVFLGIMALLVVVGLGIPAGVISSIRPNSWTDNTLLLVALAGASIPSFWLGLMLMVVVAGKLHLLPSSGFTSVLATGNIANLKNLILPAISLGFVNAALVARTARSSMLDVLGADYITTARAKGLSEWAVIAKHALRNAAIPTVTVISFTFASLVSGAVVTENVFALPGVGSMIVQSVLKRDYPVIQGIMMVVAVLYVVVNFFTDLTYAMLDPRIRYR
ncbi:ABC transporter permease [Candidatus Acetothermia bacterium]|nr:ABC transporter permease [Candidatus Bipolaricaulota bacterium]RLE39560.1 MAG: ABC transporter permease [Candidatus Acetothermia bacterium]